RASVNAVWPLRQGFNLTTSTIWKKVAPGMEALPATRVTIVDVATRAGVGVATVSRVLNGHSNVRPATRARILDAIDALDYRPSSLARSLSLGKTMVVAVVLPWFTSPSAVERVRGIIAGVSES